MQEIFDYFVTQLNDNTDNLVYKGNFIFKFYQDTMTVLEAVSGKLVNEEVEFSPVAITLQQPVPFVENNKRIDWLIEFGLLVRIEGQEYDASTDLDYANIKSVTTALQGATYQGSSVRYVFKTQPPQYRGYTVLGNSKYAILNVVMNITEIAFGYFGQDSVITLGGNTLDWTNISKTSTRRYYSADKKDTTDNDYNAPLGRATTLEITFNYNGETTLLAEVNGKTDLEAQYIFSETFNEGTAVTWTVTIQSASEILERGTVKKLTLRLLEV